MMLQICYISLAIVAFYEEDIILIFQSQTVAVISSCYLYVECFFFVELV